MSWQQTLMKRRRSDVLFSDFIRQRDRRCRYKFKCWGLQLNWHELDCSHFIGRSTENTRIDPENADGACRSCHDYAGTSEGKKRLREWKEEQLGTQRFNALLVRGSIYKKKDEVMARLIAKELLKTLKN